MNHIKINLTDFPAYALLYWAQNLLNQMHTINANPQTLLNSNINFDAKNIDKITETLNNLYKKHHDSKLHIYDSQGTIAILDLVKNRAWANDSRFKLSTDFTFDCEIASIDAITRVNRKQTYVLNDFIWNLFWNTPDIAQHLCAPDGHYKIYYWPKPNDQQHKKILFQLSACFIQGGKISTIAEQLNIPIETVQRFIGACITINNFKKINAWDPHYSPAVKQETKEEVGFIKSFFSNLRQKFNL